MANRPITIQGINPSDGSLILSDNGSTDVDPGDSVTWNIGPNSGVASIDGIVDNSTIDIFSSDPTLEPNSTSWQGTVSLTIPRGTEETYTINFTPEGETESRSYDPIIKVNS
jgi:hypothetical protein